MERHDNSPHYITYRLNGEPQREDGFADKVSAEWRVSQISSLDEVTELEIHWVGEESGSTNNESSEEGSSIKVSIEIPLG